jgi:hypothetical protein
LRVSSPPRAPWDVEGLRERIAALEEINQKVIKTTVDMESRVAKVEHEHTTAVRQSTKMLDDVAGRLLDFGALIRELPSAADLHATIAKTKATYGAHDLEELMMKIDGRLLMVEDHVKTAQQKSSSLESSVASAIRTLMQEHRHFENSMLEKINDIRGHSTQVSLKVDRVEQELLAGKVEHSMIKNSGTDFSEKWYALNSKIESSEEARRKDSAQLSLKVDRLEQELLAGKVEHSVGTDYNEKWYMLNSKIESYEEARRKDKRDHSMLLTKYENLLASTDRSIHDMKSRLDDKVPRSELQEMIMGRLDWASGMFRKVALEASEEVRRKDRLDQENFISKYGAVVNELHDDFSDFKSKLEEKVLKTEFAFANKVDGVTKMVEKSCADMLQEQARALGSELRAKLDEVHAKIDDKSPKTDLQKYGEALSSSCRDLSSSILAVRQEVSNLEGDFKEMGRQVRQEVSKLESDFKELGDSWSKRDRDFVNLSSEWSKRDAEMRAREEELGDMERHWSKRMWGYATPRRPHNSHSISREKLDDETKTFSNLPVSRFNRGVIIRRPRSAHSDSRMHWQH